MKLPVAHHLFINLKLEILIVAVIITVECLASLVIPVIVSEFSKEIFREENIAFSVFSGLALLLIVIIAGQGVLKYFSSFKVNLIGAKLYNGLSCQLYDHIQKLPLTYFKNNNKGETLSVLTNDVAVFTYFCTGLISGVIPLVIIGIGSMVLMMSQHFIMGLIIVFVVPCFLIILKLLNRKLYPLSHAILTKQANGMAIAAENFNSIKLLKAYTKEEQELQRFQSNSERILDLRKELFKTQAIISPLIQFMVSVSALLLLFMVYYFYEQGSLSIPELVSLVLYGVLFARPIGAFAGIYGQSSQAKAAVMRLSKVLDEQTEPYSKAHSSEAFSKGKITIKNVQLSHGEHHVFSALNLTIPERSTALVVGRNGSGKTTLLHMLARFIDFDSGQVKIDDVDITEIDLLEYREQIGYVPQDVAIVSGTILDNIKYGYPEAKFSEIELVAKQSGAHEFIMQLPYQYETIVGEDGAKVSGGQRQKIALARALLFKPKILLMDEPTSMLDKAAIKKFIEVMQENIVGNMTVLIVSHDLALEHLGDQTIDLNKLNSNGEENG